MNYYVATGINTDGRLVQVCVEVDPTDEKYAAAIACCHKAQEFWINLLKAYKAVSVASVKPLHGMLSYQ